MFRIWNWGNTRPPNRFKLDCILNETSLTGSPDYDYVYHDHDTFECQVINLYMYICCTYLFIWLSVWLSFYQCTTAYHDHNTFECQVFYLYAYISYIPIYLSIYLIYLSIYRSYIPIYLSIYLSIYLLLLGCVEVSEEWGRL